MDEGGWVEEVGWVGFLGGFLGGFGGFEEVGGGMEEDGGIWCCVFFCGVSRYCN